MSHDKHAELTLSGHLIAIGFFFSFFVFLFYAVLHSGGRGGFGGFCLLLEDEEGVGWLRGLHYLAL